MKRLQGKIAVVTGAADGIGHAIAERMAEEGAHVFVSDIADKHGEAFVKALRKAGHKADYVHCDVTEDADIAGLIAEAVEAGGRLDIMVNNAAIAIGGMPVTEMTDEQWHRLITVNLTSVFRGCKHALPHMIRQRAGSIINMASAQGHIGLDGWTAYAGAKGAVMAMTRQMAVEFGPHNVRINSISPGTINTPMNDKVVREIGAIR
jgi:NAD(P)-dependent dehydrogenase (short-subunit alcohol dehydrogenase family)